MFQVKNIQHIIYIQAPIKAAEQNPEHRVDYSELLEKKTCKILFQRTRPLRAREDFYFTTPPSSTKLT